MRTRLLLIPTALLAAFAGTSSASAKPAPGELAQQAYARRVLVQIQNLDAGLEHVVQAWDGANLRLAAIELRVRANRTALRFARRNLDAAEQRLAQRLVVIYETGEPSALDVLIGARSMNDLIDRLQTSQDVATQDRRIADQTAAAARRFAARQRTLTRARGRQRATLAQLGAHRAGIQQGLAERQRLLVSIKSQIATLQARERAREAALAAEARVRISREQRVLASSRARAAQAAQEAPARRHAASPPATQPDAAAAAAPPAPAPIPAPIPAPTPTPAPTPAPAASTPSPGGGGHPEAAAIAARYLGVPYRWGGSSPAGFDCSGLVSYVYAQLGISLPHYTVAQWNATSPVAPGDLQPGDLVFFDGLGHVGIYIGGGQFIHAPHTGDVVSVSSLAEGWYASHLDGARRP
ncbi:MAG: NlpC/P60 family protein [Gaiellaceae bacterium]